MNPRISHYYGRLVSQVISADFGYRIELEGEDDITFDIHLVDPIELPVELEGKGLISAGTTEGADQPADVALLFAFQNSDGGLVSEQMVRCYKTDLKITIDDVEYDPFADEEVVEIPEQPIGADVEQSETPEVDDAKEAARVEAAAMEPNTEDGPDDPNGVVE